MVTTTTTHVEVTYGHTLSDRPNDYIPGMDGWRPGAAQELISLALDVEAGTTPEAVAEAIFEATNAPRGAWSPLAHAVEAELARHRAAGTRTWVMDVGDTVVVAGVEAQPVFVECAAVGFTRRPLSDMVEGPRFYIVSEKHGLVATAEDQDDAELLGVYAAIATGTVYVHDRRTELA